MAAAKTIDPLAPAYLCGIPFTVATHAEVLAEVGRNIAGPRTPSAVAITNTESMYFALRRAPHGDYLRATRFSLCDGMGVTIAGRAHGVEIPRYNGPVFMEDCCAYGVQRGWRHFFYGGKPGVAEVLAQKLQTRFPGMIVAGTMTPDFHPGPFQEPDDVLARIEATRPDIIWVGLGLLKQERWIADHIGRLNCPWFAGVGAAFDFHAGTIHWAPRWVQAIGLEWLYRLPQEPKRLLPRNARSFAFLGQALLRALPGFRR